MQVSGAAISLSFGQRNSVVRVNMSNSDPRMVSVGQLLFCRLHWTKSMSIGTLACDENVDASRCRIRRTNQTAYKIVIRFLARSVKPPTYN